MKRQAFAAILLPEHPSIPRPSSGWQLVRDLGTPLQLDLTMTSEVLERSGDTSSASSPDLPLHVEMVDIEAAARVEPAWADLCTRALERNVFLHPGFMLPLLRQAARRRPSFLLAWDETGRLLGLMPLTAGHPGGVLRVFRHKLVPIGTPLLDGDQGDVAFAAMLAWLGASAHGPVALLMADVTLNEAVHAAVTRCCAGQARILGSRERAVLRSGAQPALAFQSAKRRKELRRQLRRLEEKGRRTYTIARNPTDVARALDRFLALERSGWKGARGTALLSSPDHARFVRQMARLMAEDGRCRIDATEIDGESIAMGIILTMGDRAFFWKTAYDERWAQLSPGVHFTLDLSEVQGADPAIATTDSCAMPDHPMIERLWSDRVTAGDLMIALHPDRGRRFEAAWRRELLLRALQAGARALRRYWLAKIRPGFRSKLRRP